MWSHRYKCRAYWTRAVRLMMMIMMMMIMMMMMMQVRPAEASSSWSPDTGVLTIRAPVAIMAADLRF